jgi:hypothetical protein
MQGIRTKSSSRTRREEAATASGFGQITSLPQHMVQILSGFIQKCDTDLLSHLCEFEKPTELRERNQDFYQRIMMTALGEDQR